MMFILSGAIKDDVIDKIREKIKAEIARSNGKIVTIDNLGLRSFARPIKKKELGYYIRMDVEMDPTGISGLNARLRLSEDIVRFQITIAPDPSKLVVPTVAPAATA
ncbi:MAG: 30S ribosomal protein S6 [Verrucomicrobia bacterium]|nr:30S ribosomal protein S6 [Verrucomicrobiota bacterium]